MGRYNLVSFSFGGDDLQFPDVMQDCILQRCPADSVERARIHSFAVSGLTVDGVRLPSYRTFLTHVATTAVVPDGQILVMGYPELFENPSLWPQSDHAQCQLMSRAYAARIRGWAGDLNATIGGVVSAIDAEPASQRNGVHITFVDPVSGNPALGIPNVSPYLFEPSRGVRHELCSSGSAPWLNGLSRHIFTRSFHPNAAGEDAMGHLAAIAIGGAHGAWTAAPLPLPVGADTVSSTEASSIACPSADSCVAVSYDDGGGQPVVDTLSNGRWTAVDLPAPIPPDVYDSRVEIGSLACPAVGHCVAVGTYSYFLTPYGDPAGGGLIETLADGEWEYATVPAPRGGDQSSVNLASVSCPGTYLCTAIGGYETSDDNAQHALLDTLVGSRWTEQTLPTPAIAGSDPISTVGTDVVCSAIRYCQAIGSYGPTNGVAASSGLFYHETGGSWSVSEAPVPKDALGASGADLLALSCPSAESCEAYGAYQVRGGTNWRGVFESLRSGTWSASEAPLPSTAASDSPEAPDLQLTCSASGSCVAVGDYLSNSNNSEGVIETLSDGLWRATAAPLPSNGETPIPVTSLSAVSCPLDGLCVAVGEYLASTDAVGDSAYEPLIETLAGDGWQPTEGPLPTGLSPETSSLGLQAVSCAESGECYAVGGETAEASVNPLYVIHRAY